MLSPLRENAEIHIAIRQEELMRAEARNTASDTKLGQTSKIRQKLELTGLQRFDKLECEQSHAVTGNGNYMNLEKLSWKNS